MGRNLPHKLGVIIFILIFGLFFRDSVYAKNLDFRYENSEISQGIYLKLVSIEGENCNFELTSYGLDQEIYGISFNLELTNPVYNYIFNSELDATSSQLLSIKKEEGLIKSYAYSSIKNRRFKLPNILANISFQADQDVELRISNIEISKSSEEYYDESRIEGYGGTVVIKRKLPLSGTINYLPYIFAVLWIVLICFFYYYHKKKPRLINN